MRPVTLKLYPDEFYGLCTYLSGRAAAIDPVPLPYRSLADQVLLEYAWRLNLPVRLATWRSRNPRRSYAFSLPASVAKALHGEMQQQPLNASQQALLMRLDQAFA